MAMKKQIAQKDDWRRWRANYLGTSKIIELGASHRITDRTTLSLPRVAVEEDWQITIFFCYFGPSKNCRQTSINWLNMLSIIPFPRSRCKDFSIFFFTIYYYQWLCLILQDSLGGFFPLSIQAGVKPIISQLVKMAPGSRRGFSEHTPAWLYLWQHPCQPKTFPALRKESGQTRRTYPGHIAYRLSTVWEMCWILGRDRILLVSNFCCFVRRMCTEEDVHAGPKKTRRHRKSYI